MTTYLPEGMRLHTMENQTALQSVAALQAAMHRKQILEARATGRRSNWHCRGNNQGNCTDCKGWKTRLFSGTGTDDRCRRRSTCDSLSPTSTAAMLAGIFIALYPRRCPASSCDPHGEIRLFCRHWLWDSIYDSHRLYLCFSNLAPLRPLYAGADDSGSCHQRF